MTPRRATLLILAAVGAVYVARTVRLIIEDVATVAGWLDRPDDDG